VKLGNRSTGRDSSCWFRARGDTVVYCPLTKDKVVRPEQLSEWAGAHRVHGSWLQVDQNGTRDVLAPLGRKKERKTEGQKERER